MISDLYLSHAFDLFDLNDDSENAGQIPIEQLQSVMCGAISTKNKIDIEQWEDFIDKFDENKDRLIDYNEFKKMMMSFHEHFSGSDAFEDLNLKNQQKIKLFELQKEKCQNSCGDLSMSQKPELTPRLSNSMKFVDNFEDIEGEISQKYVARAEDEFNEEVKVSHEE